MFWSQVDDNSINDLLTKEDVTLEEILDHESILQECKIQNEKLIKYFCVEDNFSKLLKYILVTPSEDIEERKRFKYPSIVCEVLTSDVMEINDILINGFPTNDFNDSKSFTDRVFKNFDSDMCINPLTMSYIVKILLHILKYNNIKVMEHINRREDSLNLLLKHVENNAIVVFFTEFLMCDDEDATPRIQWLSLNRFANKCVRMFSVTEYKDKALQELLCEVIGASLKFFANKSIRDEIKNQLNGQLFLELIFTHLSDPKADCNLITGCLKIVRTVVDFEIESGGNKIGSIKEMILKYFDSITLLLSSPPKQIYEPMSTTIGQISPFGPTRLEIVYLMASLLKLNDCEIIECVCRTNILNVLLSYVLQFPWNTMFQLGLLKIFEIMFIDLSVKCQYKSLLENLVKGYDIYSWFMTTINEVANESLKLRPGCIGLLWKIGNHLDSLLNSPISNEIITDKERLNEDNWSKIVNYHLKPRNDKNTVVAPTIDSCFKDVDAMIVDIDEDSFADSNNEDMIINFCQNKSSNLDDMFGSTTNADDDNWIVNQLKIPDIPVDEVSVLKIPGKGLNDETSSSDDEDSPAVIRQKSVGTECKYIFSDSGPGNFEFYDVPEFNDEAISSFAFDDLWKNQSPDKTTVRDNWANFNT